MGDYPIQPSVQTSSSHSAKLAPTSSNVYSIQKELGTGKFFVYKAYDNKDNKEVALKAYPSKYDRDYFEREEYVLSRLDHPNVISYLKSFDNITINNRKMRYCMALEYAQYGDLFDIISVAGGIPEQLARTLFLQLVEGVQYIHSNKFAHMDLKVDNLLLDEQFQLKITDFDLAQCMVTEKKLFGSGTIGYRAPEVTKGRCNNFAAADIYSMGVILFILFTGYPPYNEDSTDGYDHFYKLLRSYRGFWEAHSRKKGKDFYSEEFMDLVNWMLSEKPGDRPSIQDIKNHPWCRMATLKGEEYEQEMKNYLKKANRL